MGFPRAPIPIDRFCLPRTLSGAECGNRLVMSDTAKAQGELGVLAIYVPVGTLLTSPNFP